MGLFDFIPNLFGTDTKQESSKTGTINTQNNAWDQIQPYMGQYLSQFSAGNIANATVPISPYQTSAANNQQTTTANLAPGYQAASNVASTGISPTTIQGYMSPYIQNVVDATRNDFNTQNARANAGVQAQAAKLGALTGTQGTVAKNLAMESQRRQQDPIIAGLYNQGYSQAADLATKDASTRLAGASTLGGLTNAQTAANTGLSNIGQSIWGNQQQNILTPFNLTSQGAAGLSPFLQGAGSTTNSSGTDSSNTSQNPGLIPSLMGLAGLGFGGFDYGKQKGWFADGGRVDGDSMHDIKPFHADNGGSFHDKVFSAFKAMHKMKEYAKGGTIEPYHAYADGGGIGPWETMVEREPQGPTPERTFVDTMTGINKSFAMPQPYQGGSDPTGLTPFMVSLQKAHGKGYAKGGVPEDDGYGPSGDFIKPFDNDPGVSAGRGADMDGYGPTGSFIKPFHNDPGSLVETRVVPDRAPVGSPYSQLELPRPYYGGRPAEAARPVPQAASTIRPMSPEAQFASVLLSGSPIAGSGKALMELQQQRIQEEQNKREAALKTAEMTGNLNGQPTLAGARNPATIAHLNAQTKLAEVQSDKEFLLEQKKREMEYAKELADAAERAKWDRMFELRKRIADEEEKAAKAAAPTGAGRFKWVPSPAAAPEPKASPEAAPPAAAPEATPVAPPAPVAPLRNNRGQIIYGTPQSPFRDRSQAGFGQYYIGPDGKTVYRRGNLRSGADSIYFGGP